MAFSGLSFPTLTYGSGVRNTKVIAMMPVAITGNGTFEYRVNRSAYTRYQWTIPVWDFVNADRKLLLDFWNAVGGQLQSFLWTDPIHNTFANVNLGTGTQINPPATPTLTTSTTGGTIAASTTLTYGVTARNAQGESTESATTQITTGSGSTNSNTVAWAAVTGATSYNVYQGGLLIGSTSSLSFVDTGYPQGVAAPTVNGTGTQNYPLLVPVAGALHPIWHPSDMAVNGSKTGWSLQIVSQQPVVQYPAGSCPLYGVPVLASGSFAFAVRFNMPLEYTMLGSGQLQALGPAEIGSMTMMEVFE